MYDIEMQGKKLLVFDMDGTLFDTSESNFWSYHDAAAKLGYEIDYGKFMIEFVGRNYKEFLPVFGIVKEEDIEFIHDYKKEKYKLYIEKIRPNNDLIALIKQHKKSKIISLATTASRENTYDILEYFGIKKYFDYILTQEDVTKLKPNPECYLKIMNGLKISPDNTLVFEDSEVGIQAAIASGASYIEVNKF